MSSNHGVGDLMKASKVGFGISGPRTLDVDIVAFARRVEELGFSSIHLGDHVISPFEPLTTLTAIGIRTERLKLATSILDMNRRNPAITAHMTATLDNLSKGRLILGAGCGMWNWPTYNVLDVGDSGRTRVRRKVSRAKEAIEVLKKFWTESSVDFNGEFYNFEKASIEVKPLQRPHPPIWIAAYGKRMKKIAATLGDGFITQTVPPSMYRQEIEEVRHLAEIADRDPKRIKPIFATLTGIDRTHKKAVKSIKERAQSLIYRSVRDHADYHNRLTERLGYDEPFPWKSPEDVSSQDICQVYLIGTPEEIISRIEEYRKNGTDYLIMMGMRSMDNIRMFSDKVLSCFKDQI
jgi:alkanesulfonate monooxygenase SsuD/methylene tetrahydromethanopterin reductase-like flavin-dependent oxidoreductase (luciferase family)